MLDQFDFVNNAAVRLSFNVDNIPLTRVEFEGQIRNTRRTRMQRHGTWPGRTYVGEALVHMEGQILEQNSTDFNTTKLAILNTILPDPTIFPVQDRKLGYLEITLTGMTESARADCTIDGDISIPMEGLSPSRAPIQITWVVFNGYFVGSTSGNPYYLR